MKDFPFYHQTHQGDCGPTCLKMIAAYYAKPFHRQQLKIFSQFKHTGSSLFTLSTAAKKLGFKTAGQQLTLSDLQEIHLPAILHWDLNHFVVLTAIMETTYTIADPAKGFLQFGEDDFLAHWKTRKPNTRKEGVVLTLWVD